MIYGLPERLEEQREKYEMSQRTAAKRSGLGGSYVYHIFGGNNIPS